MTFINPSYIFISARCVIHMCRLYRSVHKSTINNLHLCNIGLPNWCQNVLAAFILVYGKLVLRVPHFVQPWIVGVSGQNWLFICIPRAWAPSQYKDCLFRYDDFHYKDKTVVFMVGIPMLVQRRIYIETVPECNQDATCNLSAYFPDMLWMYVLAFVHICEYDYVYVIIVGLCNFRGFTRV